MFVNSGAADIVLVTLSSTAVETAIAQCTSRWAMARGHRLNISIVLVAVHGLSGLFRTVSAVEPSLRRPLPTLSLSLIGHLASVDVKQHESFTSSRSVSVSSDIQICIESLVGWMYSNKLKLNAEKTEVLPVASTSRLSSLAEIA